MIDPAKIEHWRQRWASEKPAPPTEAEARLLRNTFGTIKPKRRQAA